MTPRFVESATLGKLCFVPTSVNLQSSLYQLRLFPMPPPHSLTPAQLALQAERRALKEAKKAAAKAEAKVNPVPELANDGDKAKILQRRWIARDKVIKSLRIVTWNVRR